MTNSSDPPPYRDPALPIAERVADLLSRMTLQEKAAQMQCVWNGKHEKLLGPDGRFSQERAAEHFGHACGLGQVGRPGDRDGGASEGKTPRETAALTNAIQRYFVERSRLGVPVLFHDECLHGHVATGATSFPQPIGLAATFNRDLVRRVYETTAIEARSVGVHQALTPVVDVARDARWGRVEETFGEDPYLAGEMGVAAVRGFQGDGELSAPGRLIATLKHFAAHGQPESGNNCAPVSVSERHLRETFLYPFQHAITRGGAMSVMASYNEIDGVPSHANRWLLGDVLRGEWGFTGYVVSDYYALRELAERPELYGHHVAADAREAALLAARAGVNIELPEPDCYLRLIELVEEGTLGEKELDALVEPLLAHKFKLGLFENPYVDEAAPERIVGCGAHAELALEAARQTITLLKNDGGAAPLDAHALQSIAVIGPNAHRSLLGGYSGRPARVTTVLEGVRERLGDAVNVLYHEGCKITRGGSWWEDEVVPSDPGEDRRSIAEAVEVARQADAVVLAVGGNEQTSREAWMGDHLGDRTDLHMVGLQDELADALAATGKPLLALLFNGRPLATRNLAEKAHAVLECWYLGQETGRAVAEVLFGDVNPSGKLPITIPRSAGHVPAFYNHRPSARRGYLFDDASPLFPFGFGLSYSRFEIGPPELEHNQIATDGATRVTTRVTNAGDRPGEEVVQLYIRDCVSSVTRPVKELKGFERVALQPGETRTVAFEITPESLAFWNIDRQFVVEPGEFDVMVGPNSAELKCVRLAVR